jgi:hypothetical protein
MEPDGRVSNQYLCFLINVKDRKAIRLARINFIAKWESASWQNITSTEIVNCIILFFSLYLAYQRISFYIKITTYHLSIKFESQNEDRLSNFAKIFIFLLSNGVFPMLLTENTTKDTCQSNLRGAWKWRARGHKEQRNHREFRLCILCDSDVSLRVRIIWKVWTNGLALCWTQRCVTR